MSDEKKQAAEKPTGEKAKQKAARRHQAFYDWLRQGGERQMRRQALAEIYDVEGIDRVRSSAAGGKTFVAPVMDPRLRLDSVQRGVGTYLGHCIETLSKVGPSTSGWSQDRVDVSRTSGGEPSESARHCRSAVVSATRALLAGGDLRYPLGASRGEGEVGRHDPIPILRLVTMVCVQGRPILWVAMKHEWTRKSGDKMIVPDRQKKHLASGLRDGLDEVAEQWAKDQIPVPSSLFRVDVE